MLGRSIRCKKTNLIMIYKLFWGVNVLGTIIYNQYIKAQFRWILLSYRLTQSLLLYDVIGTMYYSIAQLRLLKFTQLVYGTIPLVLRSAVSFKIGLFT